MANTKRRHTKPPVEYGPCPWWSREILEYEYVKRGKTKAGLAREWGTTWGTIDSAIERHGLAEAAA